MRKLFLILFLATAFITTTCSAIETVDVASLKVRNKTTVVLVGITATALPATPLAGRKVISVQNLESGIIVYLGNSSVTANEASTGGLQLINKGDVWSGDFTDSNILYGIATTPAYVVVMEAS